MQIELDIFCRMRKLGYASKQMQGLGTALSPIIIRSMLMLLQRLLVLLQQNEGFWGLGAESSPNYFNKMKVSSNILLAGNLRID